MRRFAFGSLSLLGFTTVAAAQRVPGRELLQFPIGAAAEAPPLATELGDGLWNPALIALSLGTLGRIGVAKLDAPADQGVGAQSVYGAFRWSRTTVGLSIVRAEVGGILRTETDPQSLGEIRYGTTVISGLVARQMGKHLTVGLASRFRLGEIEGRYQSALLLDGGVLFSNLSGRDGRIAVATFLWSPDPGADPPTISAAFDFRPFGHDSLHQMRAGYAVATTPALVREHFVFAAVRTGHWVGRGGLVRTDALSETSWHLRMGIGLQYGRYRLGLAREESGAGLGPTYQFLISSLLR